VYCHSLNSILGHLEIFKDYLEVNLHDLYNYYKSNTKYSSINSYVSKNKRKYLKKKKNLPNSYKHI